MTYAPRHPDYAHQARAGAKADGKRAFAYFMEMGTGKSKTCLDDLGRIASRGVIDRVLVVAGKGSYADWAYEHIPTHWREDLIPAVVHLWRGGKRASEVRDIERFLGGPPALRFLVMNLEAIGASARAQKLADHFVSGGKTAIVVDEASNIKSRDAIRTRMITRLGRKAVARRILTGTPVTQSPTDLWAQSEFLQRGLLGWSSFRSFRAHFCTLEPLYLGKRKIDKVTGYRNLDELEKLVEPWSFRAMKTDCLDLPPKVYERVSVELTDEQRRAYDDMRRFAAAEVAEGKFASATMEMALLTRLHQIVCGHVRTEDGGVVELPCNRAAAVLAVAEEAGGKMLVWCAHRHDVQVVSAALRAAYGAESVGEYFGGTSEEDRAAAIRGMQEGNLRFLVLTQQTGGFGITLTAANVAVYYSNTFNLSHRLQSEDRCHRIGQKNSVTYVDLVAPGTIDEKVLGALRGKKEVAHQVMGDGVQTWLRD